MSFLVMVFLTLICLADWDWEPPLCRTPQTSALLALGFVALIGLHAWWVAIRFAHPVTRDACLRDVLLPRYERGRFRHQFVLFGLYGLSLLLGWGWAVRSFCRWGDAPLPGVHLLTLLPYLAGTFVSWVFFYDADRAAHRAAHRLLDADPFAPAWTETRSGGMGSFGGRWAYVAFQARQKLALVLIPILLVVLHREVEPFFPASWREWQVVVQLLGLVVVAAVFVSMPLAMRLVLGLKPLPAGPVRDRLLAASARMRFRCSEILLWNTRSGMANAMVVGLLPWLRYVVFTDRLLEEFTEDEVEAVFGHEVGHVRHHHMLYYLVFLTLSMTVLGLVADHYLVPLFNKGGAWGTSWLLDVETAQELFNERSKLGILPVAALVLSYVLVVFGTLSRRCERQADVYGCKTVSCSQPLCCGHEPSTELATRAEQLCPTGIRTFVRALEKVCLVNGIDRNRPGFLQSWQHGSIAGRVEFLQRVLRDPAVEPAFQWRLSLIKWGLLVVLAAGFGLLVALHGW